MISKRLLRISTLGMSREAWLEHRRNAIGGSDAAAIVGLNSYSSPFSVWADKTGRLPEKPDTEAMRQGRDLENYVAQRWSEATGKKVHRVNAILYNPDIPFAHANVDRWVRGENAGLECKTTSIMNLKKFKNGEYPANYYVQCMHYMAVTGADRWYLGVLVLNQGFYDFVIERDEEEIAALLEQEEAFWKLVQEDTPPAVDGSEATTDAMQTIYRDVVPDVVELFGREELLSRYDVLTEQKKNLDAELNCIKQELMADLGEKDTGACPGWKVTWKRQIRRSFDEKAFRAENPDIGLEQYFKQSYNRVMRITKIDH